MFTALGTVLNNAITSAQTSLVPGIIVIGFLADKVIFSPWERFLHRRWGLTNS